MVAYFFQSQFAYSIQARTKRQTIRADRKRHARPGETLQLYTAMRTRHCRLLGTATCTDIAPIRIDLGCMEVESPVVDGSPLTARADLDRFARADGFPTWLELWDFWLRHHPGVRQFSGIMILWGDTFAASPLA